MTLNKTGQKFVPPKYKNFCCWQGANILIIVGIKKTKLSVLGSKFIQVSTHFLYSFYDISNMIYLIMRNVKKLGILIHKR